MPALSERREGLVPERNTLGNDTFDNRVQLLVLVWVEVVNIARDPRQVSKRSPLGRNTLLCFTGRNIDIAGKPLEVSAIW